jgi:hypothetical protein
MSEFREDFQSCLAELEAVTAQLRSTDPEDFGRVQSLLGRRQAAIAVVAPALAQASPQSVERARMAWSGGAEVEERIKLVQAAAREQLREIYRLQFHLRAVSAPGVPAESGSHVELEA